MQQEDYPALYQAADKASIKAQTMYQALVGNGLNAKANKYLPLMKKYTKGTFDQEALKQHVDKLLSFKKTVKK